LGLTRIDSMPFTYPVKDVFMADGLSKNKPHWIASRTMRLFAVIEPRGLVDLKASTIQLWIACAVINLSVNTW
jgi:hypothetical protein